MYRLILLLALGCAFAQQSNVTTANTTSGGNAPIVLGQSVVLSGTNGAIGQLYRDGLLAAFREANSTGGVAGHPIELITLDDGYIPANATANVMQLIDQDHVFAIVGEFGTPTTLAASPYAINHSVPFVAPFSGASSLRDPFQKYLVNFRASYHDENSVVVPYLVNTKKCQRMSVFYQNDTFGIPNLQDVATLLEASNMSLVSNGSFERNSLDISAGYAAIKPGNPDCIMIFAPYPTAAEFIKTAKADFPNATFGLASFVSAELLATALDPSLRENVVVSAVVPIPTDNSTQAASKFRSAITALGNSNETNSFTSFEGYLAGQMIVDAFNRSLAGNAAPSADAFLNAVYSPGFFSFGGLTFGPLGDTSGCQCNQLSRDVWLTMLNSDASYSYINGSMPVTVTGCGAPAIPSSQLTSCPTSPPSGTRRLLRALF